MPSEKENQYLYRFVQAINDELSQFGRPVQSDRLPGCSAV